MKTQKQLTAAEILKHAGKASDLTVGRMLEEFVSQIGGMEAFCRERVLDYKKANPGSPTRQRINQLIANLAVAYTKTLPPRRPVEQMSNEELDRELQLALKQLQAEEAA